MGCGGEVNKFKIQDLKFKIGESSFIAVGMYQQYRTGNPAQNAGRIPVAESRVAFFSYSETSLPVTRAYPPKSNTGAASGSIEL